MANPTQAELDAIETERRGFFSRDWFARLLSGRMAVGDSFWMGNFGVALALVPVLFMIALALAVVAPGAMTVGLALALLLTGIYRLALLRALWISLRRAGWRPLGWGIAGLVLTAAIAAGELGFALMQIGG